MTDDLDAAADELSAARAELRESLLLAAEWVRLRAADDPVAHDLAQRLDAAFHWLTASSIAAATVIREDGGNNPLPRG